MGILRQRRLAGAFVLLELPVNILRLLRLVNFGNSDCLCCYGNKNVLSSISGDVDTIVPINVSYSIHVRLAVIPNNQFE